MTTPEEYTAFSIYFHSISCIHRLNSQRVSPPPPPTQWYEPCCFHFWYFMTTRRQKEEVEIRCAIVKMWNFSFSSILPSPSVHFEGKILCTSKLHIVFAMHRPRVKVTLGAFEKRKKGETNFEQILHLWIQNNWSFHNIILYIIFFRLDCLYSPFFILLCT